MFSNESSSPDKDEQEHLSPDSHKFSPVSVKSTEVADNIAIKFEGDEDTEIKVNSTDLNKFVLVMCCAVIAQKWLAGS